MSTLSEILPIRPRTITMSEEAYDLLLSELRGLREEVRRLDRAASVMEYDIADMEERLMDRFYASREARLS